ncbi:MAG: hypothetical protein ACE5I3_13620 [Phycisphaerae bacterium]
MKSTTIERRSTSAKTSVRFYAKRYEPAGWDPGFAMLIGLTRRVSSTWLCTKKLRAVLGFEPAEGAAVVLENVRARPARSGDRRARGVFYATLWPSGVHVCARRDGVSRGLIPKQQFHRAFGFLPPLDTQYRITFTARQDDAT